MKNSDKIALAGVVITGVAAILYYFSSKGAISMGGGGGSLSPQSTSVPNETFNLPPITFPSSTSGTGGYVLPPSAQPSGQSTSSGEQITFPNNALTAGSTLHTRAQLQNIINSPTPVISVAQANKILGGHGIAIQ